MFFRRNHMRKSLALLTVLTVIVVSGFSLFSPKAVGVSHAQQCAGFLDLVLVLDESGSILGDFAAVQAFGVGITNTFALSESQAKIGVVSFDNSARVRIGLSADAGAVIAAINGGPTGGGTDIADGITVGQSVIAGGGRSGAGKVMVLLSDGGSSLSAAVTAATAAKNAGTVIFTVAFGSGADVSLLNQVASNGVAFLAADPAALSSLTSQLAGVVCNVVTNPGQTPGGCPLVLPSGSVVGELTSPSRIYWAPGQISPTGSLQPAPDNKTYWVIGVDETGEYYKLMLECQFIWVPVGVMAPAFGDPVWNGTPLPTRVVS
jgi:uncharacterized protein YegL